jgi:HEAT repeat protein/MinD-like ATPase involved in chromosome partitioning or flagellar assembly
MTEPDDTGVAAEGSGVVYTFYSYKGGVGRSMALANVGVTLALNGRRVLLVDWDLEAPGLEHYFGSPARLEDGHENRPGVIELLQAHADGVTLPWQDCCRQVHVMGCSLDLIASGRRSEDYRSRVQHLDWRSLYEDHQIGNFIEYLREAWRGNYDYVLVDSRTGISDNSDISTVLLPDVLVLFFVTNQQNIEGVRATLARARRVHAKLPVDRSKLLAVPVLSRDERDAEYEQSAVWQAKAAEAFADAYGDWLPEGVSAEQALHRLYLPYVPYWSFGERLPALEYERERLDPSSLGVAYTRLATLLANDLDWRSLTDTLAAESDVASTRQQLQAAREALRETEEQAEDLRQRAREGLAQAERAQAQLLKEAERALQKVKLRERLRAWALALLVLAAAGTGWAWLRSSSAPRPIPLSERTASPDATVRAIALSELIRLGPAAKSHRQDIERLLADPDPALRAQAVRAWSHAGLVGTDSRSAFDALLRDPDPLVVQAALEIVGLEGPPAKVFAPRVVARLGDGSPVVRAAAADALAALTPTDDMVGQLARGLKDPDPRARAAAARAFGRVGPAALRHFDAIAALREDTEPDVRMAVAETLARLGEAPAFAELLKDAEPAIRGRAAQVLAELGEPGEKYAPEVAALLRDSDPGVRARAVSALARMGPAFAPYRRAVALSLRDTAWPVRLEVVKALGRLSPRTAEESALLARALRDDNPVVREAAAGVLGERRP